MAKILVTGGAGFIGSHVVDELIMNGHDVVALDNLSGGYVENVNPRAQFVRGDFCNPKELSTLFQENQFKYVFHLGAYAAEGLSHFIKRFNYQNNLIGSINLINASINAGTVRAFVFTSSIAVYGKNQLPMTETMTPSPEDPYGIAKLAVELELHSSYQFFGLPFIIFRPHNVYGERQNIGDRYRNVIGIFMNQALQNKPFTIFGDGKQQRAFSYISDVAPIIARSIETQEAYGQTFNIGADVPCTVNHLAEAVASAMDIPLNVVHLPARNEVTNAFASHTKAHHYFGHLIKNVPLSEGITRMAKWARQLGPQQPTIFKGIEVWKNMPPSWSAGSSGICAKHDANSSDETSLSRA